MSNCTGLKTGPELKEERLRFHIGSATLAHRANQKFRVNWSRDDVFDIEYGRIPVTGSIERIWLDCCYPL